MTQIILLGMNHKTAPVEIREQISVICREKVDPLEQYQRLQCVDELFYLSTCNRVEFLFTTDEPAVAKKEVTKLLTTHLDMPLETLAPCLYSYAGLEAVSHLFRVAASLDSMVVGEPQILGQIKTAYRRAARYRTVGVILNRLLHKTFSVAKRVRSETSIGSHAVSISYAAVELARKIFGTLHDKRVLVIGAGEMAELALEHLRAHGVRHMQVTNRTLERAVEMAQRFHAATIPFTHIYDALNDVDIVLTSTGSTEPIIRHPQVKKRMRQRRNRPLFFIDIAVPRDIEPKVNRIDNVYLYDIDDLHGIVELNRAERRKEAEQASHIVAEETLKFKEWLQTLDVVPTIIALRRKAETIRRRELKKTFSQLPDLTPEQRQAIEILSESILSKILHDPILFLKKKSARDTKELFVDFTQQLFNLMDRDPLSSSRVQSLTRPKANVKLPR